MRVLFYALVSMITSAQEASVFEKVEALSAINKYDEALQACSDSEKASIKLKDAETVLKLREMKKALEALKKEYAKVKDADAKLAMDADDPDANLVMGRFWAFIKDDWGRAIPLLAKSSDPFLKALAEGETKAAPTLNGPQKIEIGDAWWNGSTEADAKMLTGATGSFKVSVDKETLKKAKGRLKARAGHWYEQAWALLQDSERDRLRPKFKAMQMNPAAGPDRKGEIEGWKHYGAGSAADLSGTYVRSGRYALHAAPNAKGDVVVFLASNDVRLIPGKKYELSAWCLTDGKAGGGLNCVRPGGFSMTDADGKPFQIALSFPSDQPYWSRSKVTFAVPKGSGDVTFRIELNGKNGQVWIDDLGLVCEGKEVLMNGSFEK